MWNESSCLHFQTCFARMDHYSMFTSILPGWKICMKCSHLVVCSREYMHREAIKEFRGGPDTKA